MGWKQFVRQMQVAARQHERETRSVARRVERAAVVQHRELVRQHRQEVRMAAQMQKELERQSAAAEAEEYANYMTMLMSVHADCSEPWNWHAVLMSQPPIEPVRQNPAEAAARTQLQAHSPNLFDKMLGVAKQQRAQLEEAVRRGIALDQQHYEAAMHDFRAHLNQWNHQRHLAPGVLALQPDACRSALRYVGAFDDLERFGTRVTLDALARSAATFSCVIEDQEIVAAEEVKLTASGKLSTKEMAASKYWAAYQDHVASCAIRIAREACAVTPVERVIVNVKTTRLDPSTGHPVCPTVLAVHFTRGTLGQLNFAAIDPSQSLKNFPHRMKFKKTAGFEPVEEMTSDEQWVTT